MASGFKPGDQVIVPGILASEIGIMNVPGTVIGHTLGRPGDSIRSQANPAVTDDLCIVCVDDPYTSKLNYYRKLDPLYKNTSSIWRGKCPPEHVLVVNSQTLYEKRQPAGDTEDYFKHLPSFIRVYPHRKFTYDEVRFSPTMFGRPVCWEGDGSTVMVSWNKLYNTHFYSHKGLKNCYSVPTNKLAWATYIRETRGYYRWPFSAPGGFKLGDLVIYGSDRKVRVGGADGTMYNIGRGACGIIMEANSEQYIIRLVAGVPLETLNSLATINTNQAVACEKPPFVLDNRVEIIAKLDFRNRNLQGLKGRVISPTDTDGDVGVEFYEEVGGGSLDGRGANGKCLYINEDALKDVSC